MVPLLVMAMAEVSQAMIHSILVDNLSRTLVPVYPSLLLEINVTESPLFQGLGTSFDRPRNCFIFFGTKKCNNFASDLTTN
jgi:hypothetical protein